MAHPEQIEFCESVRDRFPTFFRNVFVLDGGSLDLNGSNRYLFENCTYVGVDLGKGDNVDVVSKMHELDLKDEYFDTIISTEAFEHDMHYQKSIPNLIRMLSKGGLFLFTCATTGRPIHGTEQLDFPDTNSSPFTRKIDVWKNYYKNLVEDDIRKVADVDSIFLRYCFETNHVTHDLYFWGLKKW
jgi:SAM-dependent methyltransferase